MHFLLILSLLVATIGFAQSQSAQTRSASNGALLPGDAAVVGVWRAQQDGLPWVSLNVTDEGGALQGAILFYLHRRDDAGKVAASPGTPEPLLHPRFDGRTLTFDVSHRRAHPPGSLNDPPVHFRLTVTDTDRPRLVSENGPDMTITFERSDY